MDRKETGWFKDIAPPTRTSLGDSVDYLDRLMGGKNQKQFIFPPKRDTNKNKKQTKVKQEPPVVPKLARVDVDDAKWLEDRKRRFPKVQEKSDSQPIQTSIADDTKPNVAYITRRKKTLFEKLMDPN